MNLLGKATNPEFWVEVREKECYRIFREHYLNIWENECESTPPNSLRYSDWMEIWRSGKRIEFNYFQARQQLMAAAFLSLIYPEEEKYILRVMDQLYAITNEYTWCVPAHYGQILEGNRNKIDLFAAETSLSLAEIYVLLGDRLDEFIKRRVYEEIKTRIVDSMASTPEFGFETMSNNWSSVCAGSVGCTMMLLFPEKFGEFKERLTRSINLFLSGYRDDGVCLEGPSYWAYGFGFFSIYAEMLYKYTDGAENLFDIPKVKNIATFMQKTFLSGKAIVSFSDGGRSGVFHVGMMHFLKKIYPDDIILGEETLPAGRDGCARFAMALMTVERFDEDMYSNPEEGLTDVTFYAEQSGWLIRKLPTFGFAAKGGCNKEPHNHNDVGSFIYAKDGTQILVDLGAGAYTKQYFSGERYKTFQACSRSHSLPIINGGYQKPGQAMRATDVSFDGERFSMDISSAYAMDELKSLRRVMTIHSDGVSISDSFEYTGEGVITERYVTIIEPIVYDDYIEIGSAKFYFDKSIAKPYILTEDCTKYTCYMINFDLPFKSGCFEVTIK